MTKYDKNTWYIRTAVRGRKHRAESEHVLIAEKALGHRLPLGVEVHHVDENKRNNANSNLVICENQAYHHLLHYRARVLADGFDPDTHKKCTHCKEYLPVDRFVRNRSNKTTGYHSECKRCASARFKVYCAANPEKVREWTRRRLGKHRDSINARKRELWHLKKTPSAVLP